MSYLTRAGVEEVNKDKLDELVEISFNGDWATRHDCKQAIQDYIRSEVDKANRPTHIMGKTLEEVCQILSALELERIEDLKMTMDNLGEWMERVRADHHKAMQRAMDKSFDNFIAHQKGE